jgi:hypothetical protein
VSSTERSRIACRRCHRLRYCSQRETKEDRATRAMLKIVRRLDPDDPDPCNDLPERPKGMHRRTYDRLVERDEAYSDKWGIEIMRRYGRRFRSGARSMSCVTPPSSSGTRSMA